MNFINLILFIHLLSIVSFIGGAFLFFKNNNTINHKKLIRIQVVSLALWILGPFLLIKQQNGNWNNIYLISLLLQAFTFFLFFYLVFKIGKGNLLVAGSDQMPLNFFSDGPYKYIRHPFYFTYIFNYISIYLLTFNIFYLTLILIIVYFYNTLATEEEDFFLNSKYKKEYVFYQSQTDKIIPFVKFLSSFFKR